MLSVPVDVGPRQRFGLWLESVLVRRQTIVLEAQLGLMALLLGVWIFSPEWDAFTLLSGQRLLISSVPESLLGVAFFLYGACHLHALRTEDMVLAKRAAFAGSVLWCLLCVNYAVAVPGSAAVPILAAITLASWWVYARLELLT